MITKGAKLPPEAIDQIRNFGFQNFMFLEDWIPRDMDTEKMIGFLRNEGASWSVATTDRPLALFKLDVHDKVASLERFCPVRESTASLQDVISALRSELEKMGTTEIKIQVPRNIVNEFVVKGFREKNEIVRFSGRPTEIKMMPMLRISSATERDIGDLAKLLYEAYSHSADKKFANVESAELSLRDIMRGQHGNYLPDASFVSGTPGNPVSACLITLDPPNEGSVAELFTHPLYRALGFATTELAAGMKWLVKNRIEVLTAWVQGSNDVARRLFAKIGFKEDRRLVELVAGPNRSAKAQVRP